jgi:hypothetical protein
MAGTRTGEVVVEPILGSVPMPPIIVAEGRDVQLFPSVERAENALEAVDVLNGIYEAFDVNARPLTLRVVGARIKCVRVELRPEASPQPAYVLNLLRQYVAHQGQGQMSDASIEDLAKFIMASEHR